ncbi:MAG TPA: metallopeptidase family protein [Candidatus Eisenbacteria bacterium]|nr:metallopeptidase family protein [Candidatus Eisenbacteria bacterium]
MSSIERIEAWIDQGDEALDAGDFERALACFDEALEEDAEHWGASLGRVEALHALWRTEEAFQVLDAMRPADGQDDPDRADLEARVREAAGRFEEADRLFAEAHRLAPSEYPLPIRTSESDFREILDTVLESLPPVIRETVASVPVIVEPKPTAEIADRAPHITPDVLGLFVGSPVGDKVSAPSGYPDVVLLFQRNLERAGRNRREVAREIKITLLHEYGHYLGFDEEELEHLGLG